MRLKGWTEMVPLLDPDVLYVEPNHRLTIERAPDDPRFAQDDMWGLNYAYPPFDDPDIDAPEASTSSPRTTAGPTRLSPRACTTPSTRSASAGSCSSRPPGNYPSCPDSYNCRVDSDNDRKPTWPASFYLPNVIAVANSIDYGWLNAGSAYGKRTVHLAAPGTFILSTIPGNSYDYYSGTSMATPHVVGVAALLKAQSQARDWKAIKNLILAGAGGDLFPDNGDSETVLSYLDWTAPGRRPGRPSGSRLSRPEGVHRCAASTISMPDGIVAASNRRKRPCLAT